MARIDLSENEFIERLVSQDHISSNDHQFWHQLLSCSFNFMLVPNPKVVDKLLEPYLVRLTLNNSTSLNIGSLLRVFLARVEKIKPDTDREINPYFMFQAFNGLYLLRCICKSYIETLSEEKLIKNLRAFDDETSKVDVNHHPQQQLASPDINDSEHVPPVQQPSQATSNTDENHHSEQSTTSGNIMIENFLSTMIAIIVDIPLTDMTYALKVESINTMIILLSVQMYSALPTAQSIIYKSLMQKKSSIHALLLTKTLLNNFVQQPTPPVEQGSIIIGLATELWKVLTLGYGSQDDGEDCDTNVSPLGRKSLLLLNILTNHHSFDKNPYREAIVACQDTNFNLLDPEKSAQNADNSAMLEANSYDNVLASNSTKINFQNLFEAICKHLHDDQVCLLLYLLLHRNKIFKPFIMTTNLKNIDQLVLPLLKVLYSKIERGSHHIYMVLINFIILSEESQFNQFIHSSLIRNIPWYKDRFLTDIPLGSFMTLIIIRSIQYNTFRLEDRFLHTNLFAIMANMSNYYVHLHPHVCQRLTDLLDRVTKRIMIIRKKNHTITDNLDSLSSNNPIVNALQTHTQDLKDASSIEIDTQQQNTSTAILDQGDTVKQPSPQYGSFGEGQLPELQQNDSISNSDHASISMVELKDEGLIEDTIRMLLSIINNTMTLELKNNPNLIYTLLNKRHTLKMLMSLNQSFYNEVINIFSVLTFIYNKIESRDNNSMSTEEIKDIIVGACNEWPQDQPVDVTKANLSFKYVEDEQPEEFFIPYIWSQIYYTCDIPWDARRILLFSPDHL